MKARFIRPFGRFGAGNEIELPDGSEYDHTYLEEIVPEAEDKEDAEAEARLDNDGAPAPKDGDK